LYETLNGGRHFELLFKYASVRVLHKNLSLCAMKNKYITPQATEN